MIKKIDLFINYVDVESNIVNFDGEIVVPINFSIFPF